MGVCLSCLGQDRQRSDSDHSEHTHLLYNDPYNPSSYGTAAAHRRGFPSHPAAAGPAPGEQLDPEQLKREREALEGICMRMASKLIDISHHTSLPSQSAHTQQQGAQGAPSARAETEGGIDYARLFRDVLTSAGEAEQRRAGHVSRRESHDEDAQVGEDGGGDAEERDWRREEEEWVRDIMDRDPVERSWDPDVVRGLERGTKLGVDFDGTSQDGAGV